MKKVHRGEREDTSNAAARPHSGHLVDVPAVEAQPKYEVGQGSCSHPRSILASPSDHQMLGEYKAHVNTRPKYAEVKSAARDREERKKPS